MLNTLKITSLSMIAVASFTINAYSQVSSHASVNIIDGKWNYTVFNDEISPSTNFISTFSISLNAPIVVTGSPDGWLFDTDGLTFVFWYNSDTDYPYTHDISPQSSMSGFSLASPGSTPVLNDYSVQSWDHDTDQQGPNGFGQTLTPVSAPEPTSGVFVILTMLLFTAMSYMTKKARVG